MGRPDDRRRCPALPTSPAVACGRWRHPATPWTSRCACGGASSLPSSREMTTTAPPAAPIPRTFARVFPLLRSRHCHRPDLARAGDVVDMATAGANYGYSLLWVFVLAIVHAVPVRVADRPLPVVQPARRGRARRPGEAAPGVCADAVRGHDCHGARVRRLHDPRDRRSVAQRLRLRRDLAMGARVERAGAVSGLSTELSRAGAASSSSFSRCCRCRFSARPSGGFRPPRRGERAGADGDARQAGRLRSMARSDASRRMADR